MGTALVVGLALAVAVFGVIVNHAREMYKDQKYREMAGALFLAVVPVVIFGLFWAANENPSIMARDVTLGLVGAVLGACALVWVGYLVVGPVADTQKSPAPSPAPITVPSPPPPLPASPQLPSEEEQYRSLVRTRQQMELPLQDAEGTPITHTFDETGTGELSIRVAGTTYAIPISKSSAMSVWVYKKGPAISKVFVVRAGTPRNHVVDIRQLRVVKESLAVNIGDRAILELGDGKTMQLLVVGVLYYGSGDNVDEARFKYKIYDAGQFLVPAL
jgi:hypothetical protein